MNSKLVVMEKDFYTPKDLVRIVSDCILQKQSFKNAKDAFDARVRPPIVEAVYGRLPSPYLRDWESELELAKEELGAIEVRNSLYFEANSLMGWHTNSDCPGPRTYISYSEEGGSIFRYWDEERQVAVDQVEPAGWVQRRFCIPEPPDKLWHTIYTPVPRWSFGFLMPSLGLNMAAEDIEQ